ncbi:unnamed protein product, partial [Prorocentrum cordatum]
LRSLWNGGRKNNNKKADDDGPRDDEAVLAPAVMGGPPKEPGCYVQLPSRCPKHASAKPRSWRHDAWAEEGPALGAGVREAEGGVGQLVRRLRREDALRARGARRRPRGVLARAVRLRPRRASADIRAAADVRGRRARGGAGHGAVVEGRVLRDNAPAAGVRAHPGGDRPGGWPVERPQVPHHARLLRPHAVGLPQPPVPEDALEARRVRRGAASCPREVRQVQRPQ